MSSFDVENWWASSAGVGYKSILHTKVLASSWVAMCLRTIQFDDAFQLFIRKTFDQSIGDLFFLVYLRWLTFFYHPNQIIWPVFAACSPCSPLAATVAARESHQSGLGGPVLRSDRERDLIIIQFWRVNISNSLHIASLPIAARSSAESNPLDSKSNYFEFTQF